MALPVPNDTVRVKLRAELLDGTAVAEEAQFGFWGVRVHRTGSTTDWPADVQQLANKIRDAWVSKMTVKGAFPPSVRMASVTVDHLAAANATVLDQGQAPFSGANAWVGTGGPSLPWECALAVSMYGYDAGVFTPNKGRKRGRFYLPPLGTNMLTGTVGQLEQVGLDEIKVAVVAFLNQCQGAEMGPAGPGLNDYFDLRVISRGTPTKPLAPTSTPITRIVVDSKVDAQRRRERQQLAKRVSSGVVAHS